MTCAGTGSPGVTTPNWVFENWAGTERWLIGTTFNPKTVEEVVAGVQAAEAAQGHLKAIGSRFSYSGVAVDASTTHVMNTDLLNEALPKLGATGLLPFALKDELKGARAKYFVHVEAGIKVHRLNCLLDGRGLAMPTLGASNGQSLAGVVSTGTHGSDVDMAPIADAVRAIHLVGPGGQEWWIEREGDRSLTDPGRMKPGPSNPLCPDIRIERNTMLFRAALVSMGRMGIVYSYVVEAVDAFRLTQTRRPSVWSAESALLRNAADPFQAKRFVEIVVNPYPDASGDHSCVVSTRDRAAAGVGDSPEDAVTVAGQTIDCFCRTPHMTQILIAFKLGLPVVIATATAVAVAALSPLLLIPFFGALLFAIASTAAVAAATTALVALQTELSALLASSPGGNFADQLANFLNHAVAAGQKQIIPAIAASITSSSRPPGTTTGKSFRIMTDQAACPVVPQPHTPCERHIDGLEFALDMSPGAQNLFKFIADVFALSDSFNAAGRPPAFGLSLRFTRATEALLGMQQFSRTCSVEFFALRGVAGHGPFVAKLIEIAKNNGAIPHWGLQHELTAQQVGNLYPRLSEWRQALQYVIEGHGRAETFQSTFSIARGLEPEPIQPPFVGSGGNVQPYDFGTLPLHDRRSVTLHFVNPGLNALRIEGLSVDGDFRTGGLLGPHNLELHALRSVALHGEEIEVEATFVGEEAGEHSGLLTIRTSPPGRPRAAILVALHAHVYAFDVALVQPAPNTVLDLGAVAIGDTSVAQIRLRNDGTVDAWLDSYSFSSPAVGTQIGVESGGILKGTIRDYELAFRADSVGTLATDVSLRFIDGITPPRHSAVVTLKLAATGLGTQAELTPSQLDFGMVGVGEQGAPQLVGLRNVGDQVLSVTGMLIGSDFRLIGTPPASVAPGQTEQLPIVFRPGKGGPLSTSFSIQSTSVHPPMPVSVYGIGVLQPVLHAIPDAVGYGATPVGSRSADEVVVVRNDGAVTVPLGAVRVAGPDAGEFELTRSSTCAAAELRPEGTCQVHIRFVPSSTGLKRATRATLEVEYPSPTGPLTVPLAGHAIAPLGLVPGDSALDFGGVALGVASGVRSLQMTNGAATPATISRLAVGGPAAPDFTIVSDTCTDAVLAPGASCVIGLSVTPSALGPRPGALIVTSNVPASPVSLRAAGIGVAVKWSAAIIDFDVCRIGQTAWRQTVYVQNVGTKTLVLTAVDVVGDFLFQDLSAPYLTLPPNADKTFWVWFKPTAAGTRPGALRVHSDAPGSPHALALTGVGLAAP